MTSNRHIGRTIPASHVRALVRAIVDQGYDPDHFLKAGGVTLHALESRRDVSADVFGRLYQQAISMLHNEALGMASGGPVAQGTFRIMCLCAIHRPTLATVIERAREFLDVCRGPAVKPKLVLTPDTAAVGFELTVGETARTLCQILDEEGPIRVRTSFYIWLNVLSWFAGRPLPLRRVEFAFSMPATGAQWSRMFRCPVEFACTESQLVFDKQMLDLPNVQTEQSLSAFLKSAPYRLIAPTYQDQRVSSRVLALFEKELSRRLPSAEAVGQRLGMSVSTLRRQLMAEGTSFQQLKDECRRSFALQYLANKALTYTEIAQLLGFDESSAFFRAFRRWTGMTPSAYRASL